LNPVLNRLGAIFARGSLPSIQPPASAPNLGNAKEADKIAAGLPDHRQVNIFDDVAFNEILSTPPGRTNCLHLFPSAESFLSFLLALASPIELRLRMCQPMLQIMMKPTKAKNTVNPIGSDYGTAKSSNSLLSVPAMIGEWTIKGDGQIDRDQQDVRLNIGINNIQLFATNLSAENARLEQHKKMDTRLESQQQNWIIEPFGINLTYGQEKTARETEKEDEINRKNIDAPSSSSSSGSSCCSSRLSASSCCSSRLSALLSNLTSPARVPVSKQLKVKLDPLSIRFGSAMAELMLQNMESGTMGNPMAQSAFKAGLTFLSTRGRI
jgi:hypothetical protein